MKRKATCALAVLLGASMLFTGCGSEKTETQSPAVAEESKDVSLKVWVEEAAVEQTKEMAEAFAEENPDKNYNIEVIASDYTAIEQNISKDPEAAADVFMMPHNVVGNLVNAGVLYKNTKYADEMRETMTDVAVEGAMYDGEMYGYPFGVESCLMFYNKSVLNEEDVKTFEGITAKGKIGLNLAESLADYQMSPCFMANGCYLYGEKGDDPEGTTFNNEKGLEVMKWFARLKDNENVVHVKDDMVSSMEEGKIVAAFGGPWNKNDLAAMGDDLGVAPYPTVDFGSGEKQMYSFTGVKLFGVNANTEYPLDAMAFADYLVNEENQITRFEESAVIPSNKNAQESEEVKADAVGQAVAIMSQDDHSDPMPKIPESTNYWSLVGALINDTYAGKIPESEMQAKLDQFVVEISK